MAHYLLTSALRLAEEAARSPDQRRDFAAIASLAEASVASQTNPWRHRPVGAAPERKKDARMELTRALAACPWWWAAPVRAAWLRRRPDSAALRWYAGQSDARRAGWLELLSLAGRASLWREPSPVAEVRAAGMIAAGAPRWVAQAVAWVPEVRHPWRSVASPAWLGGWLAQAVAEGWRPPGVRITLHTGPMGSGKSTALVQAARAGGRVLVVQAAANVRDGGAIRTHDGDAVPAVSEGRLWMAVWSALYGPVFDGIAAAHPMPAQALKIVVDEGQWFDVDDWERALTLCVGHRVEIVVGALDWSAQRTRLGSAAWLLSAADEVRWHRGRCVDCGEPSVITRWDGEGPPGVGGIGEGAYRPVCEAHWRAPAVDGGGR